MGRRTVDMKTLAAAKADLRIATEALKSAAANLSPGISKIAEDEEPPAETGGDIGDDLGEDDLGGDEFDEGTTGEEGGEDIGDLGDLGDMGGDMGGGGMGGGGMGGGGMGGGGFGEDAAPEGGADTDTTAMEAEVDGLRTELDAVQRTIVDIAKTLRQIRNPLGDPASGNDAMQSV